MSQPLQCLSPSCQVLIQLGHEPLAARDTKTLLGRPALAYPSVFHYVGHIR